MSRKPSPHYQMKLNQKFKEDPQINQEEVKIHKQLEEN